MIKLHASKIMPSSKIIERGIVVILFLLFNYDIHTYNNPINRFNVCDGIKKPIQWLRR